MSETEVTAKVEELMKALDEVKRYRALSSSILDFVIIVLGTVAALLSVEIFVNLLRAITGFPCSFRGATSFGCGGAFGGAPVSPAITVVTGLAFLLIPTAGILGGVVWVDRKYKRVKVGEWKGTLDEGLPGALKLLTEMEWDRVFEEIQVSKLGYLVYGIVKVVGYSIFASFLLLIPYEFLASFVHTGANPFILLLVPFVLVLTISRRDLEARYRQVWSLDALMWELRWFSSEFGAASFKA